MWYEEGDAMLKMSFTVRMKLRLKGRCAKHPRYNPEQGEGVIRGGCPQCLALYQVVAARDRATAALKALEDLATPYQIARNPIGTVSERRRSRDQGPFRSALSNAANRSPAIAKRSFSTGSSRSK
jgi:hypothetical protein